MSWAFAPLEKTVPGQLKQFPGSCALENVQENVQGTAARKLFQLSGKSVNGEVSQIGVIVMNFSLFSFQPHNYPIGKLPSRFVLFRVVFPLDRYHRMTSM